MKSVENGIDLLNNWDDGTIRVKSSHLLVDKLIAAHNQGNSPRKIFDSYPSNEYSVKDVTAIVQYYLDNKEFLDQYIAQRQKKANAIWKKIESEPIYGEQFGDLKLTD